MRKLMYVLLCVGCVSFFLSCKDPNNFDKALLPGKWQQGTLFEYYNANATGYTWDEGDNVLEEDAQPFTWTLSGNKLEQIHLMEMGGKVPKTYTVTTLSSSLLEYRDDYKKSYSFRKIN
jgi:hypothetical protein